MHAVDAGSQHRAELVDFGHVSVSSTTNTMGANKMLMLSEPRQSASLLSGMPLVMLTHTLSQST